MGKDSLALSRFLLVPTRVCIKHLTRSERGCILYVLKVRRLDCEHFGQI